MLSLLNLMILCPDVDAVEDFAYFGSVGANPVDDLINSLPIPSFEIGLPPSEGAYSDTWQRIRSI